MDLTRSELLEIGLDVLEAHPDDLPTHIGERVLGAAMARPRPTMHPGWTPLGTEPNAHAAFITGAAELGELLDTLEPDEWLRRTEVDGGCTVRDLVLHLVGVERYLLGQLGRRAPIDAPRAEDHFPVLRGAAADLDHARDGDIARAWWLEVLALIGACAELGPDHEVAYHHLGGSLRGMLIIRTFELWTHDDDIRRAVGLPLNNLDNERLALMSGALMEALPLGMALAGTTRPDRTARIELVGRGGGRSFDIALTPGGIAGEPDVTIEVTALDLCRLASNRLPLDQIDVAVTGDRSLLEPVLVGAGAFALD